MTNRYRHDLPQLDGSLFLTDGGLETTLIFEEGFDLPFFAAFPLLEHDRGRDALVRYFEAYCEMARRRRVGLVLESATWRANPDWAAKLGYDARTLADANRAAIEMLCELRDRYETAECPMVVSGNIGPRGDGYVLSAKMSAPEAAAYHSAQIETFRDTDADMVSAFTMTNGDEALGVVRAAEAAGMPVVISFTVETDGRLPSGESLRHTVERIDRETGRAPLYYMINCAHPSHFEDVLEGEAWLQRIRGVRANASAKSHAELNDSDALDAGDPVELGATYLALQRRLSCLSVLGGCCGTDHRHVGEMLTALGADAQVATR